MPGNENGLGSIVQAPADGMSKLALLIYGAGGMGREAAWLAMTSRRADAVSAFIDDGAEPGAMVNGLPVLTLEAAADAYPGAGFVAALGNPATRAGVVVRALTAGLTPVILIHHAVLMSPWVTIGTGTIVCAGSIITTNVRIGEHVQINTSCTIAHDVRLDDYATLAPGVRLSGFVHVCRGAYLGTGANVINGRSGHPLVIGENAIVGAGATVTRDVAPGTTVIGIPAKPR